MERERSGNDPSRGILIPLEGPTVDVQVDPASVAALTDRVLGSMDRYNELAPGPQPGVPSVESCTYCPFSPRCEVFWQSMQEALPDGIDAVLGPIRAIRQAETGGVTLEIEPVARSFDGDGNVTVRNIDESDYPGVA